MLRLTIVSRQVVGTGGGAPISSEIAVPISFMPKVIEIIPPDITRRAFRL
jgi:hypothetical protein